MVTTTTAEGSAPETITPRLPMAHSRYMGLSGSGLRLAIGITSGLCFLAFGYGQGDIGGLMEVESFRNAFPAMDTSHTKSLKVATLSGTVVASWNLGCFAGAVLTIFLGDKFGRKGTITTGLVLMTIGKIVQTSSFSLGQYIAGRVLAGLGNGAIASTVPAWQAECLKTHRRGTLLLVSFGACITAGLTIAYWIVYAFSWIQFTSASWRVPIALGMVPMISALSMVMFLPESPRYLILTGREREAKSVLSALNEMPPDGEDTHREFLMIKNTLLHMTSAGFVEAFKMGQYRYVHRTILAVVLQVMQQWTGVNLFMQYLGSMFHNQLGYGYQLALLLSGCCSLVFFLASLVAVLGIDRYWGRRALTMFGAAGMSGCMAILCGMAWIGTQTSWNVMTAFLFVYCIFFSIGWQGMSWLWAVELIPLSTRGPANALATAANWLCNFVVVFVTPFVFTNLKWRTYIIFAVTNAAWVPIIYFFYPETGYRSLEEVDLVFSEANKSEYSWLSVVTAAKDEPLLDDKEAERSEPYISESGRTHTNSQEKSKHDSASSDAMKWKEYCRERETSSGSGSSGSAPAAGSASPPPNIRTSRHGVPSTVPKYW